MIDLRGEKHVQVHCPRVMEQKWFNEWSTVGAFCIFLQTLLRPCVDHGRKDTSSIYTTLFQYLNVIFCMWRWLKCTHSKRSLKLAFEFHLSTVKHNVDLSSSLSYCRRDVTVKMVPADTLLQKMPEENRWSTHIESITSSSAILLFSELANTWSREA